MAHACDHQSVKDISRLHKSPSTMNPIHKFPANVATISNVRISTNGNKFPNVDISSNAYLLISHFIRENPTWAISSAYDYCLKYYGEFGGTKEVFARALHDYIMSKD